MPKARYHRKFRPAALKELEVSPLNPAINERAYELLLCAGPSAELLAAMARVGAARSEDKKP